jgi:hypothetical protein
MTISTVNRRIVCLLTLVYFHRFQRLHLTSGDDLTHSTPTLTLVRVSRNGQGPLTQTSE